jgi:hypothetical protein
MSRADLDVHFDRIDQLVNEMTLFVPSSMIGAGQFRADLAGLLVVSIAASYESCVKDILITYATGHHVAFGTFTLNNYKKLNSRIAVSDLHQYSSLFDDNVAIKFKDILADRKKRIDQRIGKNIETCYKQILSWRHDFAHAGIRNTTIEEAMTTHRIAKRVLYSFDEAFNGP